MLGNKTDLEENRVIQTDEGKHKADQHNMMFIESSAKTGDNINALFYKIASALPGIETNEIAPESSMTNNPAHKPETIDLKSSTQEDEPSSYCQC